MNPASVLFLLVARKWQNMCIFVDSQTRVHISNSNLYFEYNRVWNNYIWNTYTYIPVFVHFSCFSSLLPLMFCLSNEQLSRSSMQFQLKVDWQLCQRQRQPLQLFFSYIFPAFLPCSSFLSLMYCLRNALLARSSMQF